ncbi:MAG: flagellar biosynthetic protein FliO [Phycisphaerales bacterium JB037]
MQRVVRAMSWVAVVAVGASIVRAQPVGDAIGPPAPQAVTPSQRTPPAANRPALASQAIESTPLGAAPAGDAGGEAAVGEAGATSPTELGASAARTIASLLGVVAVIVVMAIGMRKLSRSRGGLAAQLGAGGRAPSGVIEVLGRYPVGHGQQLVLLKLDRRVLLLSQGAGSRRGGGGGFQTLCEITEPEEIASLLLKTRDEQQESLAARFQTTLRDADRRTARTLRELAPEEVFVADRYAEPLEPARSSEPNPLRQRLEAMRGLDEPTDRRRVEAWA